MKLKLIAVIAFALVFSFTSTVVLAGNLVIKGSTTVLPIAQKVAEAPFRSDHYYALFATGVVLFAFTLLFNLVSEHISNKYRQVGAATL